MDTEMGKQLIQKYLFNKKLEKKNQQINEKTHSHTSKAKAEYLRQIMLFPHLESWMHTHELLHLFPVLSTES